MTTQIPDQAEWDDIHERFQILIPQVRDLIAALTADKTAIYTTTLIGYLVSYLALGQIELLEPGRDLESALDEILLTVDTAAIAPGEVPDDEIAEADDPPAHPNSRIY